MKLENKDYFYLHKYETLFEFDLYTEHSKKVEELFTNEIKHFVAFHTNKASTMENESAAEYLEHMSDDYWHLAEKFPSVQRRAEIINIYGILESKLSDICNMIEERSSFKIKVVDIHAEGIIDRYKKYLEKVIDIDFSSIKSEWIELKLIQEIRNVLVHSNGLVNIKNSRLLNYINTSTFLDLEKNEIVIKSGFSTYFLSLIKTFIFSLYKEISTKDFSK